MTSFLKVNADNDYYFYLIVDSSLKIDTDCPSGTVVECDHVIRYSEHTFACY